MPWREVITNLLERSLTAERWCLCCSVGGVFSSKIKIIRKPHSCFEFPGTAWYLWAESLCTTCSVYYWMQAKNGFCSILTQKRLDPLPILKIAKTTNLYLEAGQIHRKTAGYLKHREGNNWCTIFMCLTVTVLVNNSIRPSGGSRFLSNHLMN